MKTFEKIREEVAVWSKANFGDQESPHFVIKVEPLPVGPGGKVKPLPKALVALGSLAPLMGIVEEIGEICEAGYPIDTEDAVGDVFIYICDYCSREGMGVLPMAPNLPFTLEHEDHTPFIGLVVWVGKLFHGTLKRHQGIRGFDNDNTFEPHRNFCVAMILHYLQVYSRDMLHTDLLGIANRTWTGVVAKRDWKGKPEDGGGADHRAS